ncbi:MAG TPA: DUF3854 domain-containing protein [Phycisphaerae bacterium]|nr:DUF3854 domain-containing protein [Phycisphaerae bacterium]
MAKGLPLENHHREHLKGSGLSDEMIEAAGLKSVTPEQAVHFCGYNLAGLLIPYQGVPGYYRLRPDPLPDRRELPKYLSPAKMPNHPYIPPGVEQILADKTRPLIITEGEKKSLKATEEGFPTIGLSGVWNWKTKSEGVLPELEAIKWKDRQGYIAFDSDLRVNSEVQAALRELVQMLEDRGARVRIVMLPSGPKGEKVGLDDFLVANGTSGPPALQQLLDTAPHLLDAVLTLIEPGLDPAQLDRRLEDVYRAIQMRPNSVPEYAKKVHDALAAAGYTALPAKDIEKAIRKVERFKSNRTGADEDATSKQARFSDAYEPVDDLAGVTDPQQWGFVRKRGETHDLVTNFTARIVGDIEVVDELEPDRRFELRIAGPGGITQTSLTAKQYSEDAALKTALYASGGAGLDVRCTIPELRSAIASTEQLAEQANLPIQKRRVTTAFGWHPSGPYLVQGGYIGENGWQNMAVGNLDGPPAVDLSGGEKARFLNLRKLPPKRLGQVRQFIGHKFVELQPHVITYSCLGLVPLALLYRSLEGYNRFALWLLGRTGVGKSFLARLTQCFFGDFTGVDDRVVTWSSTANYIQREGYFFKDAIYLVDDYKPSMVKPHEVTRLIQTYADNTARGRLQRDATANVTRPIRGMLMCTGEDLPENNASTIARTVVLRMPNSVKDLGLGRESLEYAKDFPGVTEDLIEHIIQNDWRHYFGDLVHQYQDEFYTSIRGRGNDSRIAGNFAMLAAGFEVFVGYMGDVWPDAPERIDEFKTALLDVRDEMLIESKEQSASEVFLRQLRAVLDAKRALLMPVGQATGDIRGPVVGHHLKSGHIGLIMPEAMRLVEESLPSGHTLGCTQRGLLDQLEQDGLLVERSGQRRDGAGRKLPRMAILKEEALVADETPEQIGEELEKAEQQALRDATLQRIAERKKKATAAVEGQAVSLVSAG